VPFTVAAETHHHIRAPSSDKIRPQAVEIEAD
jgi:hypothetical protein